MPDEELYSVFDSHFHVIDSGHPLIPNNGYLPEDFSVSDYLSVASRYGVTGGAVVSGSFQGYDQGFLIDALARLGSGWVGVTQLDPSTSDDDIARLDGIGVRGLRFTLARGGSLDIDLARRAHEVAGWHTELYLDAAQLPQFAASLAAIPRFSIDHLGLSEAGLPYLLDAVDRGARVKATGFGRLSLDIDKTLRHIDAVNPEALLWGTDLPGTRAPRPFSPSDLDVVTTALGHDALDRLSVNGRNWYRPS